MTKNEHGWDDEKEGKKLSMLVFLIMVSHSNNDSCLAAYRNLKKASAHRDPVGSGAAGKMTETFHADNAHHGKWLKTCSLT